MAARKKKKAKPKFDVRIGDAELDGPVEVPTADNGHLAMERTVPFSNAPEPGWDISIGDASLDPGINVEIGEPQLAQDGVLSYFGEPVIIPEPEPELMARTVPYETKPKTKKRKPGAR